MNCVSAARLRSLAGIRRWKHAEPTLAYKGGIGPVRWPGAYIVFITVNKRLTRWRGSWISSHCGGSASKLRIASEWGKMQSEIVFATHPRVRDFGGALIAVLNGA